MAFRSGFAGVVGRPNAGKSTLMNALVGEKVAITSGRPQTTRRAIRGIVNKDEGQVILVDTPGLHRPRTLLGERLNALVMDTLSDVDVVLFCLPADQKVGPGDRFIASKLRGINTPVIAVATKSDLVPAHRMAEHLLQIQELGEWAEIIPLSAVSGDQLELLLDLVIKYLPEGPMLYPEGELTDEPDDVRIAEFVREAALEGVREELPHSIAVLVDEIVPREGRDDGMVDVRVHVFVERDSQKAIIIGKGGSRLRAVGTSARKEIQELLQVPVYLDLHVKVAKDWQKDPKFLQRFGF